jgi:hypothetical protein
MQVARRKRANTITSLQKEDGTRCEEPEEINAEIQSFYQQLYTSQGAPVMADLLNLVPARVSDEMQMNLDKDFTEEEVKLALFQMHPSKAPGVDGFTAGFFQRHWDLLHDDLVAAVLGF